jgi:hypothetical protein
VADKSVPKTTQNVANPSKPKRYQITMLPEDRDYVEQIRKQAGVTQWRIFNILTNCVRENPRVVLDLSR